MLDFSFVLFLRFSHPFSHLVNFTSFFTLPHEPERFRAFVRDIARGVHFHSAEHVLSQAYFLSGTTGDGRPIEYDFIGRVEELEDDWRVVRERIGGWAKRENGDIDTCA